MTTRSLTTLGLRSVLAAASIAAAVAASHYAWSWWRTARDQQSTEDAYVRGDLTAVGSQVAGYISALRVRDNEPVRAGQVLLTIDDRDYRAKVDHARAAVAQAQADAAQLVRRETLQFAVIREADAALRTARVERDLARRDLERSSRLLADGFIAPSRHDAALTGAERTAAALARADAADGAARDQLSVIRSGGAQIAAREAQARAGVRLAQIALDNTVVRAPVSGVVGNRRVNAGEYVRAGTVLLAVVPLDGVWVEANFKETQLTRMTPGQRVHITVDSFP
ncbi:MAG: HlyD family secretion protein, partial [Burkholderiales bacterium]